MENEALQFINDGGITAFLISVLWMLYKSGNFLAPLISGYLKQQSVNGENIHKVLSELTQLQHVSNTRLIAIEKQLAMFEGVLKKELIND